MRKMICPALIAAAACALLAACAQPATPVQALPPGATPEEVVDYTRRISRPPAVCTTSSSTPSARAVSRAA